MNLADIICHAPDSLKLDPCTILCQSFGNVLDYEDIIQPLPVDGIFAFTDTGYLRTWTSRIHATDVGSTVSMDKDYYYATLDVQQFQNSEISISFMYAPKQIQIKGVHANKRDEHGRVYRSFVRTYCLPPNCNMEKVTLEYIREHGLILKIQVPRDQRKYSQRVYTPATDDFGGASRQPKRSPGDPSKKPKLYPYNRQLYNFRKLNK